MGDLLDSKEEFARIISLFLAEQLRTRNVTLSRAAEIAQKVLQNINLIDTEERFLRFVKELSGDFEELYTLGERIDMHVAISKRKKFEEKVREFVVNVLSSNMQLASLVLQDALAEDCTIDKLGKKYSQFKEFTEKV